MKETIKYIFGVFAAVTIFIACDKQNMPDPVRIQFPDKQAPLVRDAAYFERIRNYKKTTHELSFGWYGSWTAIGASEMSRLRSAPDSMDILSIWSQWHTLTPTQIADKEHIQTVNGTKVVICVLAKNFPDQFKENGVVTDAGIIAYARAFGKDSMEKYNYDGIDIDYETAIDHQGPFTQIPGAFKKFCEELSNHIGPKSNTGRLLIIDGNINSIDNGIAELCNYAVSQAYKCSGPGDLNSRSSGAGNRGWKPEQMIFTENFESLWKTGGVTYTLPGGRGTVPSLIGMADYARDNAATGFGAYHMEYEYGHSDTPYKFMRQAIQHANPAPQGDYTKTLVTLIEAGERKFNFISTAFSTEVTGRISVILNSDVNIPLKVDNSLVAAYNDYNVSEYKTIDPSMISFSGPFHFVANTQKTETPVTISIPEIASLENGSYIIPIRVNFANATGFSVDTSKEIIYLIITKI